MKQYLLLIVLLITAVACTTTPRELENSYVVLVSEDVTTDQEWSVVANRLSAKHSAPIIEFTA
ncbi:MAG: hypothetical protein J6U69_05185, partial [Alistipes sp.]|nr:hypothetical protein [Alistipes sp.]